MKDKLRPDRPDEIPSGGYPGRDLLPTRRSEQALLVGLGALAVIMAGGVLVRRAWREPALFHRAPGPLGESAVLYRIDLNSASAAELQLLPGIGALRAGRIVRSRRLDGPFGSAADLARVPGMDRARIEALLPLVRIGPVPVAPFKGRPWEK